MSFWYIYIGIYLRIYIHIYANIYLYICIYISEWHIYPVCYIYIYRYIYPWFDICQRTQSSRRPKNIRNKFGLRYFRCHILCDTKTWRKSGRLQTETNFFCSGKRKLFLTVVIEIICKLHHFQAVFLRCQRAIMVTFPSANSLWSQWLA